MKSAYALFTYSFLRDSIQKDGPENSSCNTSGQEIIVTGISREAILPPSVVLTVIRVQYQALTEACTLKTLYCSPLTNLCGIALFTLPTFPLTSGTSYTLNRKK